MTYETPEWHPAFEEYCETIFELGEDRIDVIQARVAERLEVSRPAVSEMVKRMADEGLVDVIDHKIVLTVDGRALAERVVRRHRIAERLLTDLLGLSWAEAHDEAGKWEHVISDSVESAMLRVLGNPTTCPHGNPIPGSGYEQLDIKPIKEVEVGSSCVVRRIPEELEFTPGLLEYLENARVVPDQPCTISSAAPDGTRTIEIDGSHVGIGEFAASRILVSA